MAVVYEYNKILTEGSGGAGGSGHTLTIDNYYASDFTRLFFADGSVENINESGVYTNVVAMLPLHPQLEYFPSGELQSLYIAWSEGGEHGGYITPELIINSILSNKFIVLVTDAHIREVVNYV